MEKRTFYTLVKNDHPVYGDNEYVIGVIMGIMIATTHEDHTGPLWVDIGNGDHILEVHTSLTLYQLFVGRVEKRYPGLCEFNYDVSKREET